MENNMIGNKIAKARKKVNFSQAQLAEQLFISSQAVGKWERGESIPDIVTISKLAKILSVDLNYFSEDILSPENGLTSATLNNITDETCQMVKEEAEPSTTRERQLLTDFSGSALSETDFAGVNAPKRKFNGSDLRGANFSDADLSGSSFTGSDLSETHFDGTNLTDCSFFASNLSDASFSKSILVGTQFNASELSRVKFTDTTWIDVRLTATDLTNTIFENCSFNGVDFKSSDLSGLCLDRQSFINVKFDKAALSDVSFKGATFKNVSFRPGFALTNKYYKTLKTICFEGAMMDKLTYAALKGIGVDLSKVITI